MTPQVLAACFLLASHNYNVPPAALLAIMRVEGGRVGLESPNKNGSFDLGPMQINTIWVPQLAQYWKVDHITARARVRDNACVNVHVAAWILRQRINQTGHLWGGIAGYHSLTPEVGRGYAIRVMGALEKMKVIKTAAK